VRQSLGSAAIVVALDQATKALAHRHLAPEGVIHVIGNVVRLHYVQNAGAAFSFFRGSRAFFIAVTLASVALLVYLITSRRYRFRGSGLALGLVLGGAVGNLIDRIWLSRVIDFIDAGLGRYRWPTFNVADVGISLGVAYLAIGFLLLDLRARPGAPPAGRNDA
jgi:signal peptidase II